MLIECPVCLSGMGCENPLSPYVENDGSCNSCGFTFRTIQGRVSRERLNENRVKIGLQPLSLDQYENDFMEEEFSGHTNYNMPRYRNLDFLDEGETE
jgi:hypothetical protein